jgi:dolichyl-phosphate beta-glucosyltransferase
MHVVKVRTKVPPLLPLSSSNLPVTPSRKDYDLPEHKYVKRRTFCSCRRDVLIILGLLFIGVLQWLLYPVFRAITVSTVQDFPSEMVFLDENDQERSFPTLNDPGSVSLSVIMPAYNEEMRMRTGLDEMISFLQQSSLLWEIIIVNDGSKDGTVTVAKEYVSKYTAEKIRLLNLHQNSGKGAAVRKGILRSRGEYLLFADIDGASKANDASKLKEAIEKNGKRYISQSSKDDIDIFGIAIGSRAQLSKSNSDSSNVKRTMLRAFLEWAFHTYMSLMIGGTSIEDTQCGFKMFSRAAAKRVFPILHLDRWAFDVEVIFVASLLNIPVVEVPITWHEISGSKVNILKDSLQMARDVLAIRICYTFGIWSTRLK